MAEKPASRSDSPPWARKVTANFHTLHRQSTLRLFGGLKEQAEMKSALLAQRGLFTSFIPHAHVWGFFKLLLVHIRVSLKATATLQAQRVISCSECALGHKRCKLEAKAKGEVTLLKHRWEPAVQHLMSD